MLLFIEQSLNGLQFGLLLFLLAAGLTLVFGIMDFVNLAHGSLYMIGRLFRRDLRRAGPAVSCSAIVLALARRCSLGMALEVVALRQLYGRDHLDHVLATFGLILFFNEVVRLIWGPAGLSAAAAGLADGTVRDLSRRLLSGLPAVDHRGRAGGGARCSISW